MNVAIGAGLEFDYFDTLRKIIELATSDILFVDPYLEAEFVSKYLVHVKPGTAIRLLTGHNTSRMGALLPAVETLARQFILSIEIRSSLRLHDRYLFIDNKSCYHSGASFKDGAKSSATILSEITDAFDAMHSTYDALWNGANVER